MSARFHLPDWEQDVRQKLEVLEGVYEVISNQAAHFRSEFLEIVVVVLILVEVLFEILHYLK